MAGLETLTKQHHNLEFRVTDMLQQLAAEESALSEHQKTPAPLRKFAQSQLTASQPHTGAIDEQITPHEAEDTRGCGCDSGSGGTLAWLAVVPGLVLFRRRQR